MPKNIQNVGTLNNHPTTLSSILQSASIQNKIVELDLEAFTSGNTFHGTSLESEKLQEVSISINVGLFILLHKNKQF